MKSDNKDDKSGSAKTITLKSNGSIQSAQLDAEEESIDPVINEERPATTEESEKKDLEEAATKIQAAFRGHTSRKSMKQPETDIQEGISDELSLDDPELANAATKIQATFRGHRSRKQMEDPKSEGKEGGEAPNAEEEIDIDLTDPDVHKAAVKIQATFKGHMVRKENQQSSNKEN